MTPTSKAPREPALDVKWLLALWGVARTGSLSRAAGLLGCSPSTVHQQLAALEERAGTPLYTRCRNGVSLTAAGAALAQHGRQLQEILITASADVGDFVAPAPQRVLRISAFRANPAIDTLLHYLARRASKVRVELATLDPGRAVEMAMEEEVEALLGYAVEVAQESTVIDGLESESLVTLPLWAALHEDNPHAQCEGLALAGLKGEQWVTAERGSAMHDGLLEVCQWAGFEPDIRYAVDYDSVMRLLALGSYVSLVSATANVAGLPVTLRPVLEDVRVHVYLAWRRDSPHRDVLRRLATALSALM